MPNISITLPQETVAALKRLSADAMKSNVLREMLETALKEGVNPSPPVRGIHKTVYVRAQTLAALESGRAETDLSMARYAGGLLVAWAKQQSRKESHARQEGAAPTIVGMGNRPQQARLYLDAKDAMDKGGIALTEGSTGIGKSRVIAYLALDALQAGRRVVIAAPTIALLRQLDQELRHSAHKREEPCPPFSVLLGKSQFVHVGHLEEAIANPDGWDPDQRAAAIKWLDQQNKLWDEYIEAGDVAASGSGFDGLFYTLESLLAVAPDIPDREYVVVPEMETSENDKGFLAYQAHVERSEGAQLLLVSHARIAVWLIYNRDGYKAWFDTAGNNGGTSLLIDEAHLLRETLENLALRRISPTEVRRMVRKMRGDAPKSIVTLLDKIIDACDEMLSSCSQESVQSDADLLTMIGETFISELKRFVAEVMEVRSRKQSWAPWKAWFQSLRYELQTISNSRDLEVELSPKRKLPSVTSFYPWLSTRLSELWEDVHSAALVSATLYGSPDAPAKYMKLLLSLPELKTKALPSQIAKWVVRAPCLYWPSEPDTALALAPPMLSAEAWETGVHDEQSLDDWHEAVWEMLRDEILPSAAGGVLVLCTSYETVGRLFEYCHNAYPERTMRSERGKSLTTLVSQFKSLHASGHNPIWIATGGAWTGVNLVDDGTPAAKDILLTDLVIPRVDLRPLETRDKRLPTSVTLGLLPSTAALRMKQGIGRLIRREGLKNRRIWVLDGRLNEDVAKRIGARLNYTMWPTKRVLLGYRRCELGADL